ncbi:MAG: hypothetical protein ABIL44_06610 [candidate division WOR-3 bacterium]
MKRYYIILFTFLYFLACAHKETGKGDVYILLQNIKGVDIYDPKEDSLYTGVILTGTTPNYLLFSDERGYIVNSGFGGTPSIQVFKIENNELIATYPLPQGSNPYAVALLENEMYITSYLFNKVYILNENGTITDSLNVGRSPEGIISDSSRIYVACANVSYDTAGYPVYGDAYLYVIENRNVIDSIRVGKNAQWVQNNGNEIVVLSTGDYGMTQAGRLYIVQDRQLKDSIDIGGSPGYFVVKNSKAYVVGWSDSLKVVDLKNKQVNKISLDTLGGFMGCDVDEDGRIFVVQGDWTGQNNNLIVIENGVITKRIPLGNATGANFVRVKD